MVASEHKATVGCNITFFQNWFLFVLNDVLSIHSTLDQIQLLIKKMIFFAFSCNDSDRKGCQRFIVGCFLLTFGAGLRWTAFGRWNSFVNFFIQLSFLVILRSFSKGCTSTKIKSFGTFFNLLYFLISFFQIHQLAFAYYVLRWLQAIDLAFMSISFILHSQSEFQMTLMEAYLQTLPSFLPSISMTVLGNCNAGFALLFFDFILLLFCFGKSLGVTNNDRQTL